MNDQFIVWLDKVDRDDLELVGSKAANIAELTTLGINIPPGFIVTSQAYHAFLDFNHLKKKISDIFFMLDLSHIGTLQIAAEKIKNLLLASHFPFEFAKDIIDAYFKLGSPFRDAPIALRCSFVNCPYPLPSKATFLNIFGEANLIESLKKCWSSLFAPANIILLKSRNYHVFDCSVAVLLQKMVQSQASGVLNTSDLFKGQKNVAVIDAIYGLGELGAEEKVKPDRYFISKRNLKILEKEIACQKIELKHAGGENRKTAVSSSRQKKQKINDETIIELAKIGNKIQEYYYFPQELEWALEKNRIYVLQARHQDPNILQEQPKPEPRPRKIKVRPRLSPKPPVPIAKGEGVFPGISVGYTRLIESTLDFDRLKAGEIIVTKEFQQRFKPLLKKAIAVVCEQKNQPKLSILAYENGLPWIEGVKNATKLLPCAGVVKVDGRSGTITRNYDYSKHLR